MTAILDTLATTGLGSSIVLALGIGAIFAAAFERTNR